MLIQAAGHQFYVDLALCLCCLDGAYQIQHPDQPQLLNSAISSMEQQRILINEANNFGSSVFY